MIINGSWIYLLLSFLISLYSIAKDEIIIYGLTKFYRKNIKFWTLRYLCTSRLAKITFYV
jgi:hypothetical protein